MAGVVAAKYVTDDAGMRIGVLIGIDEYHRMIPFEQAVKEIENSS
jgi:hypothetical protein